MKKHRLVVISFVLALSACGGGGDDGKSNSDVGIYASCGNVPNYSADIGLIRWKTFPVTVNIDLSLAPSLNIGNNREIYTRAIKAGSEKWAVGNGIGALLFTFVDGAANADILIKFGNIGVLGELGRATWARDGNFANSYITRGTSILFDIKSFGNLTTPAGVIDETTVRQVAAHEMGHALFSNGHSKQPGDVMAGLAENLSQRDVNTIREAYCRPL